MKNISIDNGNTYFSGAEAFEALQAANSTGLTLDDIAQYMDDEARERVAWELAPCTDEEFLRRYLEIAPEDLVIG